MKPFSALGLFLAAALFLACFIPAGRHEAEDAFFYARQVETGSFHTFFHAHHLLYLPLGRAADQACRMLGYDGRALTVLTGWSLLSAAFCVAAFGSLLRRAGRNPWPWTLILLASHGFWRYAVEAEIFTPMLAPALGALWIAHSNLRGRALLAGALLLLAVSIHTVALAAVGAVAILFWMRGERRAAVGLATVIPLLFIGALYAVQATVGLEYYRDAGIVRPDLLHGSALPRAIAAAGDSILSANFLFSIPAAATRIEAAFPYRFLSEELWTGRHALPGVGWICVGTALAAIFASIRMAGRLGGGLRERIRQFPANPQRPLIAAASGGFLLAVAAALYTEPDNPEMWLMAGPTAILLAALLWPAGSFRAPWILAGALLAHNGLCGMLPIRSAQGDYLQRKADWVLQEARSGDVLITADSYVFFTYLVYQTPARVMDAKTASLTEVERILETRPTSGRVFIFDDVLHPLPPALHRAPDAVQRLEALRDFLQSRVRKIHEDEFGGIHEVEFNIQHDQRRTPNIQGNE